MINFGSELENIREFLRESDAGLMKIESNLKNYFSSQKEVLCVYLFGSQASGKENTYSDVDIAVLFEPNLTQEKRTEKRLSLIDRLSSILNKDVDVVVLNEASSFLRFQIIKEGKRIYERVDRDEHSFEANTIVEYFDFLPVRRRMETAMLNNIKRA